MLNDNMTMTRAWHAGVVLRTAGLNKLKHISQEEVHSRFRNLVHLQIPSIFAKLSPAPNLDLLPGPLHDFLLVGAAAERSESLVQRGLAQISERESPATQYLFLSLPRHAAQDQDRGLVLCTEKPATEPERFANNAPQDASKRGSFSDAVDDTRNFMLDSGSFASGMGSLKPNILSSQGLSDRPLDSVGELSNQEYLSRDSATTSPGDISDPAPEKLSHLAPLMQQELEQQKRWQHRSAAQYTGPKGAPTNSPVFLNKALGESGSCSNNSRSKNSRSNDSNVVHQVSINQSSGVEVPSEPVMYPTNIQSHAALQRLQGQSLQEQLLQVQLQIQDLKMTPNGQFQPMQQNQNQMHQNQIQNNRMQQNQMQQKQMISSRELVDLMASQELYQHMDQYHAMPQSLPPQPVSQMNPTMGPQPPYIPAVADSIVGINTNTRQSSESGLWSNSGLHSGFVFNGAFHSNTSNSGYQNRNTNPNEAGGFPYSGVFHSNTSNSGYQNMATKLNEASGLTYSGVFHSNNSNNSHLSKNTPTNEASRLFYSGAFHSNTSNSSHLSKNTPTNEASGLLYSGAFHSNTSNSGYHNMNTNFNEASEFPQSGAFHSNTSNNDYLESILNSTAFNSNSTAVTDMNADTDQMIWSTFGQLLESRHAGRADPYIDSTFAPHTMMHAPNTLTQHPMSQPPNTLTQHPMSHASNTSAPHTRMLAPRVHGSSEDVSHHFANSDHLPVLPYQPPARGSGPKPTQFPVTDQVSMPSSSNLMARSLSHTGSLQGPHLGSASLHGLHLGSAYVQAPPLGAASADKARPISPPSTKITSLPSTVQERLKQLVSNTNALTAVDCDDKVESMIGLRRQSGVHDAVNYDDKVESKAVDFDDKVVSKMMMLVDSSGADECLVMLDNLEGRIKSKRSLCGAKSHMSQSLCGAKSHMSQSLCGAQSHMSQSLCGAKSHMSQSLCGAQSHMSQSLCGAKATCRSHLCGAKSHMSQSLCGPKATCRSHCVGPQSHMSQSLCGAQSHMSQSLCGAQKPHVAVTVWGQKPHVAVTVWGPKPHVAVTVWGPKPHVAVTVWGQKPHVAVTVWGQKPHVAVTVWGPKPHVAVTVWGPKPHVAVTVRMKNGPGYLDVAVSSYIGKLNARGTFPMSMSVNDYARRELDEAVYKRLTITLEGNRFLDWEHLDQGIVQLIKKLPPDCGVNTLREIALHSFKNVENVRGCLMSILNSKIREDRRSSSLARLHMLQEMQQ
eukprot:gene7334-456_t